jgi:hypothetical protein
MKKGGGAVPGFYRYGKSNATSGRRQSLPMESVPLTLQKRGVTLEEWRAAVKRHGSAEKALREIYREAREGPP